MLNASSSRVQDCYRRADECARRAAFADDAQLRAFWQKQEARWIQVASYSRFSDRIASFLQCGRPTPAAILREDESEIDGLMETFSRTCAAMKIDPQDTSESGVVALAVVKAARRGMHNSETLYDLVLQMLSR